MIRLERQKYSCSFDALIMIIILHTVVDSKGYPSITMLFYISHRCQKHISLDNYKSMYYSSTKQNHYRGEIMLLNALRKIGFTQQEAIIYISLCKNGELTGYEAAKFSGISRSNAYAALSTLVDKGYAHIIEGPSSKYIATPKDELIQNAQRDFQDNIQTIRDYLDFTPVNQEPYITIVGETQILNKLKNIINAATKRIYISCSPELLNLLKKELENASQREMKIVILSSEDILSSIHPVYYRTDVTESFKMIADTQEVLAGTFKQCLFSKNPTLLSLIKESFINEIAVIEAKQKN